MLVAALAALGYLSWDRWFRYDDAKDIQGTWSMLDGSATMVIDNRYLILAPGVKYEYSLNTMDKTISFSFDELGGDGRYQFSKDRKRMAIVEGGSSDLIGDISRTLQFVQFDQSDDPTKTTVLAKTSTSTDASNLPEKTEHIIGESEESAAEDEETLEGFDGAAE